MMIDKSQIPSRNETQELISDYILADRQPQMFPRDIMRKFFDEDKSTNELQFHLSEAAQYAYGLLNNLYSNEYRYTKSYLALNEKLEKYEVIYQRLAIFNMITY